MQTNVLFLRILFGILFCFAGIMHIIRPNFFKNFIPDFLPKLTINYVFGLLEFLLGLGLIFLPIHIWDATKVKPAIGSKKIAFVRIPLQFLLMYFAYILYMNS